MEGRAEAPAAGTVLNALANGVGSAFAIDAYIRAEVSLDAGASRVTGSVSEDDGADTRLIERCVELAVAEYGEDDAGGRVRTESAVPMASGLKSSSAAANAAVLATLDARGVDDAERETAARVGVRAAREVGVTVTGAFDDASASMLGGVTVTNNREDALLRRDEAEWDVLVWTPPEQAFSANADASRCERIAPVADLVAELALAGRYHEAMNVNGFAFCAALDRPTGPLLDALGPADGVSLSGTGPSYVAVGERERLAAVRDIWSEYEGTTWFTTTQTEGARTR